MSGHNDENPARDLPDPPGQTDAERIAQSLVPYLRDDARARYLGLRCSGFTIREALRLIGHSHSGLSHWRKDEEFANLESRIPEFQKQLSIEYVNLEFIRNFRLVLEKDYRVLQRSLTKETDKDGEEVPMSNQDHSYLIKMRSNYSPQQLQSVSDALARTQCGESFDFTEYVITASRVQEQIKMEPKKTPRLNESDNIIEGESLDGTEEV